MLRKLSTLTAAAALLAAVGYSGAAQAATVYSEGFEGGLGTWVTSAGGHSSTEAASGNIAPTEGAAFANIDTAGSTDLSGAYAGATVGATLVSDSFSAAVGDVITLDFQFLTTDGTASFKDFAIIQLRAAGGGAVLATLANANTDVANGQVVPATSGPAPAISAGVVLAPATAVLNGLAVGPVHTHTYGPTNFNGGAGGGSGWITSTYTITTAGSYELFFVVADFGNQAYDSALAIDNILVTGETFRKEITSGPCVSNPDDVCESDSLSEFVKIEDGIDNPSFEDFSGTCTPGPGGFVNSGTDPGDIDDWTVTVNPVHYICGWQQSQEGDNSIDMNGNPPGGAIVKQDIATVAGTAYQVKFWMAGTINLANKDELVDASADTCGGPLVKGLDVRAAGTTESFTFDTTGNSRNSMGWEEKTFEFTATGATATLEFESTTGSHCGAAIDNVMLFEEVLDEIAVAVLAPSDHSIHYDFKIFVRTEGLTNPVVYDTVPAEWDVDEIDGEPVGYDNNKQKNGDDAPGLACGESQDDVEGVDLSRGGKEGKKCQSATQLEWPLDPDVNDMVRVDLQSRMKNRPKEFFSPTGCGALFLNKGAVLMDGTSVVAETPPLCVAAVKDLDGTPGIVGDGTGDEDEDGYSDWQEACSYRTDPCTFQNDVIIDADGILTPGRGILNDEPDQQVALTNLLTNWPTGFGIEGIDGFDTDASSSWTFGDDIHLEDSSGACSTAGRNAVYDNNVTYQDCVVLDLDGSLVDQDPVDCDFESGSFCGALPNMLSGATGNVTFYDGVAGDGLYNNGEDIVLDGNKNGIFD